MKDIPGVAYGVFRLNSSAEMVTSVPMLLIHQRSRHKWNGGGANLELKEKLCTPYHLHIFAHGIRCHNAYHDAQRL